MTSRNGLISLIFACGGFEGERRLDVMEVYDVNKDEWTLIEVRLPVRLSNHACISVEDNKVLIVGGGTSDGHSTDIYNIELTTKTVSRFAKMSTGRDLRNKIVCHNDEVFTVGGNMYCTSEKLCLSTKKWTALKEYASLIGEPLDSWFSTLVLENPLLSLRSSDAMFRVVDPIPEEPRPIRGRFGVNDYPFEESESGEDTYLHPLPYEPYPLENFEYEEEHENTISDGYSYEEQPDN